jgi:uncharacterized protein YbaP (TraB family)
VKGMGIFSREKELRMLWRVEKAGRRSYLVGTVHFFPFSFKRSLRRLVSSVETVLFEGPLDEASMKEVVQRGSAGDSRALMEALYPNTVKKINRALGYLGDSFHAIGSQIGLFGRGCVDPFSCRIQGMRPWMAFFETWFEFLRQRGWRYSLDLDAYEIARDSGREIGFLETIEEQVRALDGIPLERIVGFFKEIDNWSRYAREHVRFYLKGDLEAWPAATMGFPTRCEAILDRRDPVMFDRMKGYMERGGAAVFVGIPHVRGVRPLLLEEGFEVVQDRI